MASDNSGLLRNALLTTDPELNKKVDGQISWWNAIRTRGARTNLYRAYERGDHRANLSDQMRAMLRLHADDSMMNEFCLNYCSMIIDKMTARLEVNEITTTDEAIDKNWLTPMLRERDFDASQAMWWRSATRDADTYVMVDLDTALWTNEPAYDGFSGMTAIIDIKTRKPIWGAKLWAETDVMDKPLPQGIAPGGTTRTMMHIIVYQPGRISYWSGVENARIVTPEAVEGGQDFEFTETNTGYQAQNGGQKILSGSQNMRTMPAELGDALPFVVYSNKRDSFTRYGESELRVAVPLQDLLNSMLYDLAIASKLSAAPINYSIGFEIDPSGYVPGGFINMALKDERGNLITSPAPEQLAFLQAAKVGQFPATSLAQYIAQIEMIVEKLGEATQTPIHGQTSAGVTSGEALGQLESGLVSKVMRFQQHNTDAVQNLIILTAKIQRIFHPEKKAPVLDTVDVMWKSARPRDIDKEIARLIQMRKDTTLWPDEMYRQKLGTMYGFSKDEIEKWGDMATEQAAAESERMIELANAQAEANAVKLDTQAQTDTNNQPMGVVPTNKPNEKMPMDGGTEGNPKPAGIGIQNNNKQPKGKK